MNIVPRVKEVLDSEPNDTQLDNFLNDVRESLGVSNKLFITFPVLIITALVTYHLVVYEGATGVSLNSIQISNTALFRRVFLVVPAALLAAFSCIGYLRRCQREVYDYLTISRYRILGKTGLHEFRLPADYLLGLFVLRTQGGIIGKAIAATVAFLSILIFFVLPAVYVVRAAVENTTIFGVSDILSVGASCIAITLSVCSLVIVWLGVRINAT